MEGFFSKKETQSVTRPDGKVYSCTSCGLHTKCNSPKLLHDSPNNKKILNVAGYPSKLDDVRNKTFQSKHYAFLEKEYEKIGVDLDADCVNTYSTICYTKEKTTNYQIDCCRKEIMKTINHHKPTVIVAFGIDALYSLIGNRWKKDFGSIDKWRGWLIPDQDLNAWICPVFSVEDLHKKDPIYELIFQQDMERIGELIENPKLRTYNKPNIIDISDDLSPLDDINHINVAFDYEATGLKPHAKGHRIACASVAIDEDNVYVFDMPATKEKRKPFTDLMKRGTVGKIAQNMKYEDTWTNVRLKVPVNNWDWDTMLASHQLDNRPGVSGLKFQTYVQFGVVDYSSEIDPYLKPLDDSDGANSINRVMEIMKIPVKRKQLLHYCGFDSIYTYRLADLQKPQILEHKKSKEAYYLFHTGVLALARAERQGLRIDTDYIERQTIKLEKKIAALERKFQATDFYKEWKTTVRTSINLNSGKQLRDFLYEVKKVTPTKLTKSGMGSTDVEALELMNIPELNLLIDRQKLIKIKDTYLKAFDREQVNGVLHPFFNLHLAKTFRSSSDSPNFQNIPKRDKYAKQVVRKAIYPREGNRLWEIDYNSIEFGIAGCHYQDPTMLKYIHDPTSDIHGDIASKVFLIDDFSKKTPTHGFWRSAAKNGFVFPELYGSWYKNCAPNLVCTWGSLPEKGIWKKEQGMLINDINLGEHMLSNGIKNLNQFEDHLKGVEDYVWNDLLKTGKAWQKKQDALYHKQGYLESKTGFKYTSIMSLNQLLNAPIQGDAFHCLLWSFIQTEKYLIENNLQTKIVGQVHDALVFDGPPDEVDQVYAAVTDICSVQLPKAFKWINVPLSIEGDFFPVDKSWAHKEDYTPNVFHAPVMAVEDAVPTNQTHYYLNKSTREVWSSRYKGIVKEGFVCVPKVNALLYAKRYKIIVDDNDWITQEPIQEDLPF